MEVSTSIFYYLPCTVVKNANHRARYCVVYDVWTIFWYTVVSKNDHRAR